MSGFHTDVAGIGVAVEVPALGVYVYYISQLAFKTYDSWRLKANAAKTQLDQRSIDSVLKLQNCLQQALAQLAEDEPLSQGTIDPGLFAEDVRDYQRFQDQRASVDKLYARMKRASPWLGHSLLLLLLATPALTIRVAWDRKHWPVEFLAVSLSAWLVALTGILILGSLFLSSRGRLARAVMTGGGDDT